MNTGQQYFLAALAWATIAAIPPAAVAADPAASAPTTEARSRTTLSGQGRDGERRTRIRIAKEEPKADWGVPFGQPSLPPRRPHRAIANAIDHGVDVRAQEEGDPQTGPMCRKQKERIKRSMAKPLFEARPGD